MNAAPLTELKKSGSDCLPVQYHKENPVLKQNIFSPLGGAENQKLDSFIQQKERDCSLRSVALSHLYLFSAEFTVKPYLNVGLSSSLHTSDFTHAKMKSCISAWPVQDCEHSALKQRQKLSLAAGMALGEGAVLEDQTLPEVSGC
ncbi:hypothetical protein Anapl_00787 [Anas platyrhynchos]|uniref:Uncharacterized protein n=1 Tax=Anas platyrhynchos TaxID=8839 RepID=R0L4F6_ANAPL|nr:hypothetical protein Anapl_00787 [Anas platyrhynchos]